MKDSPQPLVAAVQMTSSMSVEQNLQTASRLIREAKNKGADIIVLPEYFALMAGSNEQRKSIVEKHGDGPIQRYLANQAKMNNVWLIAGSLPVASADIERFYGRCYIFNDAGHCVTWYDKIHLFDVIIDKAGKAYRESDYTMPGKALCVFDTPWRKVGVGICYDLRFPELFQRLVKKGAELIVLPAAFTQETGEAHWEALTKARAIENQVYFVAAAQAGAHQNGRQTFGHSCILSPWGETLDLKENGEGVICAALNFEELARLRQRFPVLANKGLY